MLVYQAFESKTEPGEWRVEAIDHEGDGECYVAIFSGPNSQERATSYAAAMNATRLTPEQREEGRRLLERYSQERVGIKIMQAAESILDWCLGRERRGEPNRFEMLLNAASEPEIDVAEINRQAVREFADAVCKSQPCAPGFQGTVRALAAARGVTLDDKP